MNNIIKYIGTAVLCISATVINAQDITYRTEKNEEIVMPACSKYNVDSLLAKWHSYKYLTEDSNCPESENIPYYSDSVYIDRLSRLTTSIEMPYNDVVKGYIELYSVKLRKQVSYMLGAYNFYMPLFEDALSAMDLPLELKYLPMIESSLNPTALSRAGASGLWQFMTATGKIYGLEVNSLVDERRDPIKSTWAAVKYLKEMYDIYKDWHLVIAAYNCGPGNVNKAIKRAGGNADYWAIYNYLPKETRGYVPIFIAANYIMNYYCEHNICPMETSIPASTDTIMVDKRIHFKQIAELCDVSLEEIEGLNPQYKKQVIPGDAKESTLRLPTHSISRFIEQQDTIHLHRQDELFKNRKYIEIKESDTGTKRKGKSSKRSTRGTNTTYKVKKGDSLSKIASKHGVKVSDIKAWNNLKNNNITAGKSLIIKK